MGRQSARHADDALPGHAEADVLKHITRLVPVPRFLPPLFTAENDETHLEGCRELRENFVGAESVSVGATDRGYKDAGIFGTLVPAE